MTTKSLERGTFNYNLEELNERGKGCERNGEGRFTLCL